MRANPRSGERSVAEPPPIFIRGWTTAVLQSQLSKTAAAEWLFQQATATRTKLEMALGNQDRWRRPVKDEEDLNVQNQQLPGKFAAVSAHPIAELLDCPPETHNLLNGAALCLNFKPGDVAFRQGDDCRGLYLVIAGEFLRKTDRLNTRVTLGSVRSGDIVELASALSSTRHTYTLTAIGQGTLLLLPESALASAFELHPPLRMRLLQELAREVSRAYLTCTMTRTVPLRRRKRSDGNGASHL